MIIDPSIQAKHHFPGFKKMTSTFFFRTMLWVEMFSVRRRFNKSTNSSSVGISSMALLAALFFLPLSFLFPFGYVPSVVFYLIYLYGYGGFLLFVLKKYPKLFGKMFVLNIYYTLVIALGACYGLLKVLINQSSIVKEFNKKQQPDNG